MKYTKIIISALLAVTLTACGNAAETEETTFSESITSETVLTEESVLTTKSETESETTTTAETTTETTTESVTKTTSETTAETTTEPVTETTPPIPEEVLEAEKRLNMRVICRESDFSDSYVVEYDGDFTVDLKSITPDTDLRSFSNAAEHKIGKEFELDLDSDGKNEKISSRYGYEIYDKETHTSEIVSEKPSGDDNYDIVTYLTINGKEFTPFDYGSCEIQECFFTCDIDSSDEYIEIACTEPIVGHRFATTFFRYEDGELRELFSLGDTCDGRHEVESSYDTKMNYVMGKPLITDGSGVITASGGLCSQTWSAYVHYLYDSDSGQVYYVSEPTYPYYYENLNNFEYARNAISNFSEMLAISPALNAEAEIYSEPDLKSEKTSIAPQNIQITAEYSYAKSDDKILLWVHIVAEDGSSGWIFFDDLNNYYSHAIQDTISGLIYYN